MTVTPPTNPERAHRKRRGWKDELIALVTDVAAEMDISEAEVLTLAKSQFGREVADLRELLPDELGRLYEVVAELQRRVQE